MQLCFNTKFTHRNRVRLDVFCKPDFVSPCDCEAWRVYSSSPDP